MSGPKYSHFDCDMKMVIKAYTASDLENKVKEIKSAHNALMKKQNQLKNLRKELGFLINDMITKNINMIDQFNLSIELEKKQEAELNNLKSKYKNEMQKLLIIPNSLLDLEEYEKSKIFVDPDELIKISTQCSNHITKINGYNKLIQEKVKNLYDRFIEETKKISKKTNKRDKPKKEIIFSKVENFLIADYFDEKELKELSKEDEEKITNILKHIEEYINEKYSSSRQIKELENIYSKIVDYTKRDLSVQDKISFIQAEYENFLFLSYQIDETDLEYYKMYVENDEISKSFNINIKKFGNQNTYDEIKAVATLVKKELNTTIKDKYISDSIKDVMNEFGYNTIEGINLAKDETKEHALFDYDSESAISVYRSNEGMVMMELVATGDESEMTENAKIMFLEKMHNFCSKYPKIIEALKKKGITINLKEEMPVTKEFVKKISIKKNSLKRNSEIQLKRIGEE